MCGRYRLSKTEKYLLEKFGVQLGEDFEYTPRYNVSPSQQVPVIHQDKSGPRRVMTNMRWGLVPSWAKDLSIGSKMINARAETCTVKVSFKTPLEKRRCLIPADGFYEWKKSGFGKRATKQPFLFTMNDDSAFAFAGVWDAWKSPEGKVVESCSILTTKPNELTKDVHDRMPVILAAEQYDLWLDPGFSNLQELSSMLKPYEARQMKKVPVSARVNSPENDDEECAKAVEAAPWLFPVSVEDDPEGADDGHRGN
jgi:putative SOS response-associated peptidase YedK